MIGAALEYYDMGLCIIPMRQDTKSPYIGWKQYQTEMPTRDNIVEWWEQWPDAMIGLVTGDLNGICLLDVDSVEAGKKIREIAPDIGDPHAKTPRPGWHWYFKSPKGLTCHDGVSTEIDIKAQGGLAIIPPSNRNGKSYKFISPDFDFRNLQSLPEEIIDSFNLCIGSLSKDININISSTSGNDSPQDVHKMSTSVQMLEKGERDKQLFHLAHHLVKGKMPIGNIEKFLHFFAVRCKPPYPEKEISAKIKSALKRAEKHEINISQEVRDFILSTSGHFLSTDIQNCLQLSTRQEKKTCSAALSRLVEDKIIERYGNKNGCFRRIESEEVEIDIFNTNMDIMPIRYPLDLHEFYRTMPKNIIIVAGTQDAGKSAFLLNVALLNMNQGYEIKYFSSEMGGQELRDRIQNFEIPLEDWENVKFRELKESFQDQINPDGINIIDYLEVHDNFWLVGSMLAKIYERLNKGIAVVALQKDFKAELGRGGSFSLEKPRLYISLTNNPPEGGIAKIVKCKNWALANVNPNNRICHFKIIQGCKINQVTRWEYEVKK